MSFLGEYVLLQGTWSGAGQAAAVQLFRLAKAGYLRIGFYGDGRSYLARTYKPDDALTREEQFLLRAVFAADSTAWINRSHQIPVAQDAMAISRIRLTAEGFIRRLTPRALQRRLYWGYLAVAVITAVYIGFAIEPMAGLFVPFASVLVWIPYNMGVRAALRSKGIFLTRKGKKAARRIRPMYGEGEDICSAALAAFVRNHGMDSGWCDTPPATTAAAQAAVGRAADVMGRAFAQRRNVRGGYTLARELRYEALRGLYEQFDELGGAVRSNAIGVEDIAHDGDVGDAGDGAGDGGDGGDGGGGDG